MPEPVKLAGPWWSEVYLAMHPDERPVAEGSYITKVWKVFDRAVKLGTKDWDLKDLPNHISEAGSIELYHRPQ